MFFNINDDDKNKSGVYKIYNLLNGRTYFGSTNLFSERYEQHLCSLLKEKHCNKFLQRDVNKCGINNFIFEILKTTPPEERLKIEQTYLDVYWDKQNKCYNIQKKVTSERSIFSKNPEETKQKQRKASLERIREFYENCHSKETREKINKANSRAYKFIDPSGEIIEVFNLSKFCRDNNLNLGNMSSLWTGNVNSNCGWRKYDYKFIGVLHLRFKRKNPKTYKFLNPQKEVIETTDIKELAIKYNLSKTNLYRILSGERKHHKGWTKV